MDRRESPPDPGPAVPPTLRRWIHRVLVLLTAQFALGMWVNLFGRFPVGVDTLGGTFLYAGDPVLLLHITTAALLLGATVVTLGLSLSKSIPVLARALVIGGGLGIVLAAIGGYRFVTSGFTSEVDSYAMALGFIVAMLAYALALGEIPRTPDRPSPGPLGRPDREVAVPPGS